MAAQEALSNHEFAEKNKSENQNGRDAAFVAAEIFHPGNAHRQSTEQSKFMETEGKLPSLLVLQNTARSPESSRAELRNRPAHPSNVNEQSPEAKHLLVAAKNNILDKTIPESANELSQFQRDVAAFELRAKHEKINPQEVRETMKQVARLLETKGEIEDGVLSMRQRIRLAEQVLAKAAEPTSSDQGQNNTCSATTIENRLYTREPSIAAKLVADIALTGSYKTIDGTTLKMSPENLLPYGDSFTDNPRGDATRSFAGQIFQLAACNLPYAKGRAEGTYLGDFEYRQGPDKATLLYTGDPSKLDAAEKRSIGKDSPHHAANFNQMIDINKMLTGRDDSDAFLLHSSEQRTGSMDRAKFFSSPAELESKLLDLQKQGKLPAIIGVHTSNDFLDLEVKNLPENKRYRKPELLDLNNPDSSFPSPFSDDHVLLITGITPGKGAGQAKITFDDQSGNNLDHGPGKEVSINDFYSATGYKPAMEQVKDLEIKAIGAAHAGERITHMNMNAIFQDMNKAYEGLWGATQQYLSPDQIKDQEAFRAFYKRRFAPRINAADVPSAFTP